MPISVPARDQRFDQLVLRSDVGHPQRAVGAVPFALAADVVLELAEVREHVGVGPARVAERGPAVVVVAMAADVDEPVDRARAAQRAAARPVDLATVHSGVRLGLELPVVDRVEHRLGVPDRHVDPGVGIARPGLQQRAPMRRNPRTGGWRARSRPCRRRRRCSPRRRASVMSGVGKWGTWRGRAGHRRTVAAAGSPCGPSSLAKTARCRRVPRRGARFPVL